MKKYFLVLVVSIFTSICFGQNDFGILIKTTSPPTLRFPPFYVCTDSEFSIAINSAQVNLSTNCGNPILYQNDFFYSNFDSSSEILMFSSHESCPPPYFINERRLVGNNRIFGFNGCDGFSAEVILMHLEPLPKKYCIEETINLNGGWNWQYSYNPLIASSWENFPNLFQEQNNIAFKINELEGYENKTAIYFRTGFQGQYVNTIKCDIIPCPPKLINPLPIVVNNICSNGATGSATFTFDNDLNNDEHFLFNLTDINEPSVAYSYNVPPDFPYLADRKFTWPNLKSGRYKLKYQTLNNVTNQETSVGFSNEFTITAPDAVEFSTTPENIKCKGAATGTITVNATGGRTGSTYEYSKDGGNSWQSSNIFIDLASKDNNGVDINYNILVKNSDGCVAPLGIQTVTISEPITNIAFEESSTSITQPTGASEQDGSAGVQADGGTGTISYSWANALAPNTEIITGNTINNQPSGSYICTATDANGCKTTTTINLIAYYATIQEIASINCAGQSSGSLRATIFGGTPPFIVPFSWASTADNRVFEKNNVGAESDTFTFTDKNGAGITRNKSYTLIAPNPILVSVNATTNAKCFGQSNGTINITVSGGTQFSNPLELYTFEWRNASNILVSTVQNPDYLPVGNYTCLIKDSKECPYNLGIQAITQPAVLNVTLEEITPITTIGSSTGGIDISVSGGTAPYTYAWSNGATTQDLINVPADTYSVTITDANGCATNPASISYLLSPPTPLSVGIERIGSEIKCFGNTTTLKANPLGGSQNYPPNNYVWKKNNVIIPDQNTQIILDQGAGFYEVKITDSNGNIANSTTFELTQPTVITASHMVTNINCFSGNTGKIELTVSGGLSSATYTFEWYKNGNLYPETTQNIQNLTAGTYKVYISNSLNCPTKIIDDIIVNQPNAVLSSTISGTNPTGFGLSNGTVNLTVSGGTSPYGFLWNNGATSQNLTSVPAGNYSVTITDNKGCQTTKNKILIQPNALTANVILVNKILCNGNNNGSLKAIPTDGIAPYTYAWKRNGNTVTGGNSQVLSGCNSSNYSVLVTDSNSNQTTANYFLEQPDVLSVSFNTTPVPCNAGNVGTITTTISGGTAPYTYAWSNFASTQNINNLSAGKYVLEITDANGCQKTAQAIVASTSNMVVNQTIKNATCFGNCNGSIAIEISGGSGNYTINWNNLPTANGLSVSNLCAGNYSATIKDIDANCSIPMSFSITQPAALTLDLGADKTICQGQKTTINGKITLENCTYAWTSSNGFTANTAEIEASESGTYTLKITTPQGCVISDSVTITQLAQSITAEFLVASQTYKDEDIILINVSNISTENYTWILPQNASIVSQTPQTVIMRFTQTGSFEVKLKTINTAGCEAFANKLIIVEDNPGLPNTSSSDAFIKEFTIAPNPATNGVFNVKISLNQEAAISLTLHEIALGTLINQTNMPSAKEHLKAFDLPLSSGVYWMILRTPYGVQTKKIIVN